MLCPAGVLASCVLSTERVNYWEKRETMPCICGYENHESNQFCRQCGRELPPLSTAPPQANEPSFMSASSFVTVLSQMPSNAQFQQYPVHPYQTIGGLLLALLVIIFVSAPSSLFSTAAEFPNDLAIVNGYVDTGALVSAICYGSFLALGLLQTLFQLIFAILLLARNRHIITVLALVSASGLCGLVFLIVTYVLDPAFIATGAAVLIAAAAVVAVVSLAITILLMFYFFKSVRVRTYMKSDAYITQGPWKFVKPPCPAVPDPPVSSSTASLVS